MIIKVLISGWFCVTLTVGSPKIPVPGLLAQSTKRNRQKYKNLCVFEAIQSILICTHIHPIIESKIGVLTAWNNHKG